MSNDNNNLDKQVPDNILLNKNCCLSPGTFTRKHTIKLANKLKRKRLLQRSSKYKRRRLELRANRSSRNAVKTVLEGDTYSTNIELQDHTDIEEISVLPEKHLTAQQPFMFFDLETTGLGRTSDIIQIAAVCSDKTFNTYVFPTKPISPGASSATGLSFKDGKLLLQEKSIEAVKQKDGLLQFLAFVKKFTYPCIVGHNIKNFDVPVLINSLEKYGLCETLNRSISGFVDTLVIARSLYNKDEVNGSFSQQSLIKCLLGKEYAAHNALEDVVALRELFEHFSLNENQLNDFVFQLSYFACKSSLHALVEKKVISQNMCNKLAACSLGMSQLRKIHNRDDMNGIASILKECKIAKKCSIANKIIKFLDDLSSEA
ncbi:uncharacterized protein LOC133184042 [Saccostrea echinata]|uniref:uncharacterized protein LOC133184042 n=1 Tax=Saccostrea echinata TaxID=191078 RepID=UPI002A82BD14|nr:uncharacterized protein LOC133184042 [Saccostrea echinata]